MSGARLQELQRDQPAVPARLGPAEFNDADPLKLSPNDADNWYDLGRRDDLCSVALYYLDRPNGNHPRAPLADRLAPAPHWPAADGHTLLANRPPDWLGPPA